MPTIRMRCAAIESSTCSIFWSDLGLSQLFTIRFPNGFQQNDGHLANFHLIQGSIFLAKYFYMPSLRWKSQENRKNIPSWVADWPHCCDFEGDTWDGVQWCAMLLEASESQENAPFHRIVWPGLI